MGKNLHSVCLALVISWGYAARATELGLQEISPDVQSLVTDQNMVLLSSTRRLCDQLTDVDFVEYKGAKVSKRSKGLKRHVKHLCEKIEMFAWKEKSLSRKDLNKLYELRLLHSSLLQKAQSEARGINLVTKIKMGLTSLSTPYFLNFKNKVGNEARNVEGASSTEVLAAQNPLDSAYYEENNRADIHKRFGELADEKKIKVKDSMVVVFDDVSDSGSAPKIKAKDVKDNEDAWSIKWGDELHTDVVGSRIFAALGYDVDHPYYRGKDDLFVVFPKDSKIKNGTQLVEAIRTQFKVTIREFVSEIGEIGDEHISKNKDLKLFKGHKFITFKECALEGRPDKVKRIGSIVPSAIGNSERRELRGSLLAHILIDNWDTREENTLITVNNTGKQEYKTRGTFSDLGTSMGVKLNLVKGDFRVGIVNEFGWDAIRKESDKSVSLKGKLNSLLSYYKKATYSDLKWMASKIARLDQNSLEKILEKSGWPKPIQTLYLHKLASRRAQILKAFNVDDPHPIPFDRNITLEHDGEIVVKNGKLIRDVDTDMHPLGYLGGPGRLYNYGRKL